VRFRQGQYVCVNPKALGEDEVRTAVGIVQEDPHPFWGNGYVAVAWPGIDNRYRTVFPVLSTDIILV
jgi:hypothetical protein